MGINRVMTGSFTDVFLLAHVARDDALLERTSVEEITTVLAEEEITDERHRACMYK